MRRVSLVFLLAIGLLIMPSSPAAASVTLGQLAPSGSIAPYPGVDFIQLSVSSGNSYEVPGSGRITSWSHNPPFSATGQVGFKVFHKTGDPAFYMALAHDGPRPVTPGVVNTSPVSIPVQSGDLIGLHVNGGNAAGFSATPSDTFGTRLGLNDGQEGSFTVANGQRINVSAVFVPDNSISVGKTALNEKKGTATLNLTLPNPGELTGSGKGVKAASAGRAVISKSVAAGPAKLLIKAKGKQRKTLNETGKVKLKVKITYTPTGGDPRTQSLKVKLKKKT